METAFFVIILLLGTFYALWTKQLRLAAGLFVLVVAFGLQIPQTVSLFMMNFLLASSLIIFAVGIFIIVWKKKAEEVKDIEDIKDTKDIEDINEGK